MKTVLILLGVLVCAIVLAAVFAMCSEREEQPYDDISPERDVFDEQ